MVDKVAMQTEVQRVKRKYQDSKSRGCGTKDQYLTPGGPIHTEVVEKGLEQEVRDGRSRLEKLKDLMSKYSANHYIINITIARNQINQK